jgi:hypothetical protein
LEDQENKVDLGKSSAQSFVVPEAANDLHDRHLPPKKIFSSSLIFPLILLSVSSRPLRQSRHRHPAVRTVVRRHRSVRPVRLVPAALEAEGVRGA